MYPFPFSLFLQVKKQTNKHIWFHLRETSLQDCSCLTSFLWVPKALLLTEISVVVIVWRHTKKRKPLLINKVIPNDCNYCQLLQVCEF